jgi:DNA ligase-1
MALARDPHKRPPDVGGGCQDAGMLFGDIETALATVTNTRSRLAKIEALAALLRGLDPEEIEPAVGLLTAAPRQGRLGVGWRTLSARAGDHAET